MLNCNLVEERGAGRRLAEGFRQAPDAGLKTTTLRRLFEEEGSAGSHQPSQGFMQECYN
jgi:hypothetical protein